MSEETKLPWPGYRLRPGWRMLELGDRLSTAAVFASEFGWQYFPESRSGELCIGLNDCFVSTHPNATLPPVEPIPVEPIASDPSDVVRRALDAIEMTAGRLRAAVAGESIIADLRRERGELRKQVETLKYEYSEACKENGIVRVERDALQSQVEQLTAACEGLELEKARLENELHRMQSSPSANAPSRD